MLAGGSDPSLPNGRFESALHVACAAKGIDNLAMVDLLWSVLLVCFFGKEPGNGALHCFMHRLTCRSSVAGAFPELLAMRDQMGRTALHVAATEGSEAVVGRLAAAVRPCTSGLGAAALAFSFA
jgi:hypothetical protein